ncbi:MAG TPA: sigma-54-dependent Fis family transcriptional regulator [Nitrospirae bacterium]|nr:transcriptional regulatory protein ZraR [bacterium BMS3Abin06]HDH10724.1 sigma-54-dependent Fis family transcriptional regulator [Nitrospirota bacterium]HDZ03012.1 sigma-54-dependent Fis family transcriptional regulator [Nitrospirota bacterium]
MKYNILIIEDEINTLKVLSTALKKEKFNIETSLTGEDALEMLRDNRYDLVLTDYKLPGINGETLLEQIKSKDSQIPVILLTAYGTIDLAVNAMKKGAYTYLTKPVNLKLLISTVKDALRLKEQKLNNDIPGSNQFLNIFGKSKAIQEVFSMIQRISKTDASVLILGESGTGKELVARALHYTSLRADKPFIPIDCTTIPLELMESELFGYEKGAFTCAYSNKIGLIEMAQGGTVFFDEIGDLDYALQKKLLRFLQEKEFQRLGGKGKIKIDVRVLTATNRNLEEAVEKGEFRADLYYRLNVISIYVPSLNERKEDIPLLASHFLEEFSRKNKKAIRGFDQNVMDIFINYEWPGNVRELENLIERSVILCPYDQINVECLPRKLKLMGDEEFPSPESLNLPEMEKKIILKALEKSSWNQSKAAHLLGITRKQLRTKMKNLELL